MANADPRIFDSALFDAALSGGDKTSPVRSLALFRAALRDGRTALLVKISGAEEQAMLIEQDEARYFRPAYFGDGWVGIRLDLGDNDWDHIGQWIAKSWRAVAPKKLVKLLNVADEF